MRFCFISDSANDDRIRNIYGGKGFVVEEYALDFAPGKTQWCVSGDGDSLLDANATVKEETLGDPIATKDWSVLNRNVGPYLMPSNTTRDAEVYVRNSTTGESMSIKLNEDAQSALVYYYVGLEELKTIDANDETFERNFIEDFKTLLGEPAAVIGRVADVQLSSAFRVAVRRYDIDRRRATRERWYTPKSTATIDETIVSLIGYVAEGSHLIVKGADRGRFVRSVDLANDVTLNYTPGAALPAPFTRSVYVKGAPWTAAWIDPESGEWIFTRLVFDRNDLHRRGGGYDLTTAYGKAVYEAKSGPTISAAEDVANVVCEGGVCRIVPPTQEGGGARDISPIRKRIMNLFGLKEYEPRKRDKKKALKRVRSKAEIEEEEEEEEERSYAKIRLVEEEEEEEGAEEPGVVEQGGGFVHEAEEDEPEGGEFIEGIYEEEEGTAPIIEEEEEELEEGPKTIIVQLDEMENQPEFMSDKLVPLAYLDNKTVQWENMLSVLESNFTEKLNTLPRIGDDVVSQVTDMAIQTAEEEGDNLSEERRDRIRKLIKYATQRGV